LTCSQQGELLRSILFRTGCKSRQWHLRASTLNQLREGKLLELALEHQLLLKATASGLPGPGTFALANNDAIGDGSTNKMPSTMSIDKIPKSIKMHTKLLVLLLVLQVGPASAGLRRDSGRNTGDEEVTCCRVCRR
jgi:hypothetical protein